MSRKIFKRILIICITAFIMAILAVVLCANYLLSYKPTVGDNDKNTYIVTDEKGNKKVITLENKEGNLAFSLQMQLLCGKYYPDLTRKIYIKGYRYNLHLVKRAMLVEVGAQNNTVKEAENAMKPLAEMLYRLLSGEKSYKK